MKNSVIKVYSENKQSFNIKGLANELLEHAKRYHEYNDKENLKKIYQELDDRIVNRIENGREPTQPSLLAIYYISKWLKN